METRPYHWALMGLGMYYILLALSVGGTVVLRRRRVPVFVLWAVGIDVLVSVVLSFGQTRYRTPFEVSLALLGAVSLDWLWSTLRAPPGCPVPRGRRPRTPSPWRSARRRRGRR